MSKRNSLIDEGNHFQTLSNAEGLAQLLANIETDGLTEEAQVAMMRLQQDVAGAIHHASEGLSYEKADWELEAYGVSASGLSRGEVSEKLVSERNKASREREAQVLHGVGA